jgi:hypothetical protein
MGQFIQTDKLTKPIQNSHTVQDSFLTAEASEMWGSTSFMAAHCAWLSFLTFTWSQSWALNSTRDCEESEMMPCNPVHGLEERTASILRVEE